MYIGCVWCGRSLYVVALAGVMSLGIALVPLRPATAVGERADTPAAATITGTDLRIVDGDSLVLNGAKIRLFGIDAPELSQTCTDMRGREWACGRWSRGVMARVSVGVLSCVEIDRDRYGRMVARCAGAQGDIGAAMVRAGAAYAYEKYSTDYLPHQDEARQSGKGLWRAGSIDPAAFRAARKPVTLTEGPKGCKIKGNISKSGRLYHLPGSRWYDDTSINAKTGERWFCSEDEARGAGWRPAKG